MTREQIEQVRDALKLADSYAPEYCACYAETTCESCATVKQAVDLIDAELQRPEEREWRAVPTTTEDGEMCRQSAYYYGDRASAERFAARHPKFTIVIESRTPAGPWKEAK